MRPANILLASLLGSLAASAALTTPGAAQDRDDRDRAERERRRTVVETWPGGRAFFGADPDRAVLGLSLGAGGRSDTLGVRITDVVREGPAEKAGVEEGDRIVAINGTSLRVSREDAEDESLGSLANRRLQRALDRVKPGDEVSLQLMRGRESRTVRVKTVAADELRRGEPLIGALGGFAGRAGMTARELRDSARARAERRPALGVSVGITGNRRDTLGLFVSSVTSGGPAERAGIVEGDRIATINNVDVRVPGEDAEDRWSGQARANRFTRELQKVKPGDNVTLRVLSGGQPRTVTVRAGSAAEVFRNDGNAFSYIFRDGGDGVLSLPPMPSMAPRTPMAPLAPSAPRVWYNDGTAGGVRVLPRGEIAPRVRVQTGTRRIVDV